MKWITREHPKIDRIACPWLSDHSMLEMGMVIYDALYSWAKYVQEERHTWNPDLLKWGYFQLMNHLDYKLRQLIYYFLRLGAIGFGGPVALAGYMHRDLVEKHNWISEEDYKEGLALAQLAPGPLAAQLSTYPGFVHYRVLGATLCGIAFVLPSFIMVVLLGIIYQQFGGLPWMQAVFYGVGAAVIGIIIMSSYKLTQKSIGKFNLSSLKQNW